MCMRKEFCLPVVHFIPESLLELCPQPYDRMKPEAPSQDGRSHVLTILERKLFMAFLVASTTFGVYRSWERFIRR